MRIKDICDYVSRGATPDYVDESPYKVMNQATFSKGWLDESNVRYTSKAIQDAQIQKGDLIMASTGGGVLGKVFYYDSNDNHFYADSHVSILRNSRGANLMKYLYYFFSVRYDEINATLVKGSTNQTELQRNYLLAYELDIPSLQVQQRIVEYLDAKTTEIDNKIELLGKKRDAYKRLKIATINHAVIRGLDEHVKLKDTDIDWIGEIPVHWETRRIKDEVEVNKLTLTESTSPMYKFRYIDISNVSSEGVISFIEEVYFYEAPSRARRIVQKGDIIVSTVRTYLKSIGMIDFDAKDVVVSTGFAVLSPIKSYSKYFYYLLRSNHLIDEICALSSGVSYPAIAATRIESINIPVPPLEEQKQIAAYLDERCAKIDAAVTIIDKQIDALKRLKRSLINEVVTGKRMV